MVLRVVLILTLTAGSLGQIPIPKRPLGFVYNGGEADAPVHLDVYMGPLCPDSQMAFPTITQLATSYGPKTFQLNIHLFPLPYHRNAFLVAMVSLNKLKDLKYSNPGSVATVASRVF